MSALQLREPLASLRARADVHVVGRTATADDVEQQSRTAGSLVGMGTRMLLGAMSSQHFKPEMAAGAANRLRNVQAGDLLLVRGEWAALSTQGAPAAPFLRLFMIDMLLWCVWVRDSCSVCI